MKSNLFTPDEIPANKQLEAEIKFLKEAREILSSIENKIIEAIDPQSPAKDLLEGKNFSNRTRLSPEELIRQNDLYNKEVAEMSAAGKVNETKISDWEKVPPDELSDKRGEFNKEKTKIIKEWERINGREWPRYTEDVYNQDGIKIRQKGDRYDAHHIHPLEFGGKNSGDNITPMHVNDHHDKKGIHRPDGPYGKLSEHFRNPGEE
jgi:hypothetical protein